jgi:DNA-binding CsgD family transcriptional regulator
MLLCVFGIVGFGVLLVPTSVGNKENARQLAISTKTVKNILTTVFAKTGTRGRTELEVQIVRAGIDAQ